MVQEQHRALAQPLLLGGIQAIEDWQVLQHGVPLSTAHGMTGKDALAAPGA
jgi:hypothetical protein